MITYDTSSLNIEKLERLSAQSVLTYFSDIAIDFVATLASTIQKTATLYYSPEMQAMAFWMRKSHLLALKQKYQEIDPNIIRVGHGTVFHIAPSNVDSIFFYSWFISLLSGNKNIVRISNKTLHHLRPFLNLIDGLLKDPKFVSIAQRNMLVSYDRDDEITALLSKKAQFRVIWGGDATIEHIRQISIPASAKELTFANKFSLAIIHADFYVQSTATEKETLMRQFYNDAYWFGQQACSSPRLTCWVGAEDMISVAQTDFWSQLDHYLASQDHAISLANISDKIFTMQAIAMKDESSRLITTETTQLISRILITDLNLLAKAWHCGSGLFFEYKTTDLHTIMEFLALDVQTISYYGLTQSTLQQAYLTHLPPGGVRFVPIGQALNFHEVWDGYDLFSAFSKRIYFC